MPARSTIAAPSPASARIPLFPNLRFDEPGENVRGDLLKTHHRPGFVERPLRADHLFHQARLGAGENVADLTLLLGGRSQRVLDAAAVEGIDRLELVQRDDNGAFLFRSESAGQREDLVRQAIDVAVVLDEWEGHGEATGASRVGVVSRTSGRVELITFVSQPRARSQRVSTAASARAYPSRKDEYEL